jgi:hypothetical protein
MEPEWTIDELAAHVAAVLDGVTYPGAPNGRVRDVPDARAIRWYSTIGLVDKPGAMRGRTALYGPRHLLQLVAVQRRQAQGHKLADIQVELTGATDEQLHAIAEMPAERRQEPWYAAAGGPMLLPESAPARKKFWAERPAAPAEPDVLNGLPLPGGVVLLVPARLSGDDVSALRVAAQPLLDALAARGLTRPADQEFRPTS